MRGPATPEERGEVWPKNGTPARGAWDLRLLRGTSTDGIKHPIETESLKEATPSAKGKADVDLGDLRSA